jgi:hypothetical protein
MGKKHGLLIFAGLVSLVVIPRPAAAQGASTLQDDLSKMFKAATVNSDSTGLAVTNPGTVLVIKKGGIRAYPPTDKTVLPNTYKDGVVHAPSSLIKKVWNFKDRGQGADNSRLLPIDTKVYPTKISVDAKSDKVTLNIIECDSCNNVQQPSSFRAQITFQFASGYLQSAAPDQIADQINTLLANDLSADQGGGQDQGAGNQGGGQGGGQQQAAPPDPPKEPQSIEKGQTEDQVVAAFGKPDKIVNLGSKKLYIYKDMKITFIGGKVTDVQ